MRIDLVGTTADFRRFGHPQPLPINHLLCENRRTQGRMGEVGLAAVLRGQIHSSVTVEPRERATLTRSEGVAHGFDLVCLLRISHPRNCHNRLLSVGAKNEPGIGVELPRFLSQAYDFKTLLITRLVRTRPCRLEKPYPLSRQLKGSLIASASCSNDRRDHTAQNMPIPRMPSTGSRPASTRLPMRSRRVSVVPPPRVP